MGQIAMAVMAALLLQAPAAKGQSTSQTSVQTGTQTSTQLTTQSGKPAVTQPGQQNEATTSQASEAEGAGRPMSAAEADAAIDRLKQTIRDSMANGRGPRELSPEAQKALAESADKFLSDPAVRGAIAQQIRNFRPPWQQMTPVFWLTAPLVPIAFFSLIAVFFWLVFRSKNARIQTQMAAQAQLISKFSSGTELASFLSSPAGVQLLGSMSSPQVNVKNRMGKHLSLGAVFGTVGFGALLFSRAAHGFFVVGVIFLFLGIGFLISAWLTSRLADHTAPSVPPTLPPTPQP